MAQAEKDLGSVIGPTGPQGQPGQTGPRGETGERGPTGDQGPAGKDATIATATGTITPGHSESPTVKITLGGEPGAQTFAFAFEGIQGATGSAGPQGPSGAAGTPGSNGKDGVSVTHAWKGTTLEVTSASGTTSADLVGPQGPEGPKGPAGPTGPAYKPGGSTSQIVLGDGSLKTIASLIQDNAETIRAALGIATTSKNGLLPQLPSDPNA